MNRPDKFLAGVLSFLAGIFLTGFWEIPPIIPVFLIFFCLGFLVFAKFPLWRNFPLRNLNFPILIILIFFSAVLFYQIDGYWTRKNSSIYLNNKGEVQVRALVLKEPEEKNYSLWIKARLINNDRGKILIITGKQEKNIRAGDVILIKGKFSRPESSLEFGLEKYLAKENIYSVVRWPLIDLLDKKIGLSFLSRPERFWQTAKSFLFQTKYAFEEKISQILPQPEAGLLRGLLLGGAGGFSPDFKEKMSVSGTSHLAALSGFNVTIVAGAVLNVLLFLGLARGKSFGLTVVFLLLFLILTGGSASIARATIMGFLAIFGQKLGRIYNPRNSLFCAGLVMVILDPKILVGDVGFQLSFLASLGLIYFDPFFKKIFRLQGRSFFNWKENLSLTLAAQAAVLPFLIFYFQFISLFSLPANLLILTFIPLTMLWGFAAVLLGFVFPWGERIMIIPAYLFLKYETAVINFFGGLKIAKIDMSGHKYIFFFLAISGLIFLFLKTKKRPDNKA